MLSLVFYTDVSFDSYEVHLLHHQLSGVWDLSERKLHTNCLEMEAD